MNDAEKWAEQFKAQMNKTEKQMERFALKTKKRPSLDERTNAKEEICLVQTLKRRGKFVTFSFKKSEKK